MGNSSSRSKKKKRDKAHPSDASQGAPSAGSNSYPTAKNNNNNNNSDIGRHNLPVKRRPLQKPSSGGAAPFKHSLERDGSRSRRGSSSGSDVLSIPVSPNHRAISMTPTNGGVEDSPPRHMRLHSPEPSGNGAHLSPPGGAASRSSPEIMRDNSPRRLHSPSLEDVNRAGSPPALSRQLSASGATPPLPRHPNSAALGATRSSPSPHSPRAGSNCNSSSSQKRQSPSIAEVREEAHDATASTSSTDTDAGQFLPPMPGAYQTNSRAGSRGWSEGRNNNKGESMDRPGVVGTSAAKNRKKPILRAEEMSPVMPSGSPPPDEPIESGSSPTPAGTQDHVRELSYPRSSEQAHTSVQRAGSGDPWIMPDEAEAEDDDALRYTCTTMATYDSVLEEGEAPAYSFPAVYTTTALVESSFSQPTSAATSTSRVTNIHPVLAPRQLKNSSREHMCSRWRERCTPRSARHSSNEANHDTRRAHSADAQPRDIVVECDDGDGGEAAELWLPDTPKGTNAPERSPEVIPLTEASLSRAVAAANADPLQESADVLNMSQSNISTAPTNCIASRSGTPHCASSPLPVRAVSVPPHGKKVWVTVRPISPAAASLPLFSEESSNAPSPFLEPNQPWWNRNLRSLQPMTQHVPLPRMENLEAHEGGSSASTSSSSTEGTTMEESTREHEGGSEGATSAAVTSATEQQRPSAPNEWSRGMLIAASVLEASEHTRRGVMVEVEAEVRHILELQMERDRSVVAAVGSRSPPSSQSGRVLTPLSKSQVSPTSQAVFPGAGLYIDPLMISLSDMTASAISPQARKVGCLTAPVSPPPAHKMKEKAKKDSPNASSTDTGTADTSPPSASLALTVKSNGVPPLQPQNGSPLLVADSMNSIPTSHFFSPLSLGSDSQDLYTHSAVRQGGHPLLKPLACENGGGAAPAEVQVPVLVMRVSEQEQPSQKDADDHNRSSMFAIHTAEGAQPEENNNEEEKTDVARSPAGVDKQQQTEMACSGSSSSSRASVNVLRGTEHSYSPIGEECSSLYTSRVAAAEVQVLEGKEATRSSASASTSSSLHMDEEGLQVDGPVVSRHGSSPTQDGSSGNTEVVVLVKAKEQAMPPSRDDSGSPVYSIKQNAVEEPEKGDAADITKDIYCGDDVAPSHTSALGPQSDSDRKASLVLHQGTELKSHVPSSPLYVPLAAEGAERSSFLVGASPPPQSDAPNDVERALRYGPITGISLETSAASLLSPVTPATRSPHHGKRSTSPQLSTTQGEEEPSAARVRHLPLYSPTPDRSRDMSRAAAVDGGFLRERIIVAPSKSADREVGANDTSPAPARPALRAAPAVTTSATRSKSKRRFGKYFCRWCDRPYTSATVCPIADKPHATLRLERMEEKRTKKHAQQLLRDGKISEAVALLAQSGLCPQPRAKVAQSQPQPQGRRWSPAITSLALVAPQPVSASVEDPERTAYITSPLPTPENATLHRL